MNNDNNQSTQNKEQIRKNKWVGTWGASQYVITPDNMPPNPGLSGNTLRQVVRVSIGGEQIRLKFSNECGETPLTMKSVYLAVSNGGHDIEGDTSQVIAFHGEETVTIPAGETVTSDTISMGVKPLQCLSITICFGEIPERLTGHPGSRTNSYIVEGDQVLETSLPSAVMAERWYVIAGIEVLAYNSYRSVIALGDSITDGRGTTTDHNNRWTDIVANRLQALPATDQVGVINQGIGGNSVLFGGLGPTAKARFDRDVLRQSGIRYLVILEGVNDIGSASSNENTVSELISTYQELIQKAHSHNILVYGGTITPFGGSQYGSDKNEQIRQQINHWIRTSGAFDGVIDFDQAVLDRESPDRLYEAYDSGDHLHLSPEGYEKMGNIIDLSLFTR